MTNAEKFLKDGTDKNHLYNELGKWIEKRIDRACTFVTYAVIKNFFEEQTKPTLTEDERAILKNARTWGNEEFRYIMRTAYGLRVTANAFHYSENEPEEEGFDLYAFDHLFQFIKERRRI